MTNLIKKNTCLTKDLRIRYRKAQKHGHSIVQLINLYGLIINHSAWCRCNRKYCQAYQNPTLIKNFKEVLQDNLKSFEINKLRTDETKT